MTTDRAALEKALRILSTWPYDQSLVDVRNAAQAHLDTLPRVQPVDKWGVTYWSLTHKTTLCRVYDTEADADRGVDMNGSTARKHHLPSLEWMEPPT